MALDVVKTIEVGKYELMLRERNAEDCPAEEKYRVCVSKVDTSFGSQDKRHRTCIVCASGSTADEAIHKFKLALVEEVKAINVMLEMC